VAGYCVVNKILRLNNRFGLVVDFLY